MINLVEARTAQGELLGLPLQDVSDGYVIENIEGLDPVKATIVSSSFAQIDGTQYQSSRREARNIKLTLGLEPDWTTESVEDLRNRLYDYFMPKSNVGLKFYTDKGLIVDISGRVETCETPLFTQEPAVDVSIICFSPDFVDLTPVVVSGASTADEVDTVVPYVGSVETGIEFVMTVDRDISEFTIYNRPPDGTLRSLDFASPLFAGDTLTINTVPGSKGAVLTRNNTDSSILYGVSPQSNWIEFFRGDNGFRVYAEGVPIPYTVTYMTRYGGL